MLKQGPPGDGGSKGVTLLIRTLFGLAARNFYTWTGLPKKSHSGYKFFGGYPAGIKEIVKLVMQAYAEYAGYDAGDSDHLFIALISTATKLEGEKAALREFEATIDPKYLISDDDDETEGVYEKLAEKARLKTEAKKQNQKSANEKLAEKVIAEKKLKSRALKAQLKTELKAKSKKVDQKTLRRQLSAAKTMIEIKLFEPPAASSQTPMVIEEFLVDELPLFEDTPDIHEHDIEEAAEPEAVIEDIEDEAVEPEAVIEDEDEATEPEEEIEDEEEIEEEPGTAEEEEAVGHGRYEREGSPQARLRRMTREDNIVQPGNASSTEPNTDSSGILTAEE